MIMIILIVIRKVLSHIMKIVIEMTLLDTLSENEEIF